MLNIINKNIGDHFSYRSLIFYNQKVMALGNINFRSVIKTFKKHKNPLTPLDSVWWTICGQNAYNEKLNHLIYK